MEPLHVSDLAYVGGELNGLDECQSALGEFYEDGLRLDELDERLGESYEDCLELDELFFKLNESYELLLS